MNRNYWLLTPILLLIAGCGYLDGYKEEDMGMVAAHIVSISESRPAEVVIAVYGINSDTCVKSTGKLYAKQDGNKIRLTAKQEVPIGPGACGAAITDVYAEDTVHNLEVGEYIIVSGDYEFGRFRIEEDAAYVDVELEDFSLIITPPSSTTHEQEDISYQLKIGAEIYVYDESFYNPKGCEPNIKADINRSGDLVNIELSRVVPITESGCKIRVDGYEAMERQQNSSRKGFHPPYNTEIELGTFAKGSYRLLIDGNEYPFTLPMNRN